MLANHTLYNHQQGRCSENKNDLAHNIRGKKYLSSQNVELYRVELAVKGLLWELDIVDCIGHRMYNLLSSQSDLRWIKLNNVRYVAAALEDRIALIYNNL